MIIEYTKSYSQEEYENFSVHGNCPIRESAVFYEYWGLISRNKDKNKEELLKIVDEYTPKAKSKLRIGKQIPNQLEFFKPNKYVFPVFYIIFK